jgi:hypothetical protein
VGLARWSRTCGHGGYRPTDHPARPLLQLLQMLSCPKAHAAYHMGSGTPASSCMPLQACQPTLGQPLGKACHCCCKLAFRRGCTAPASGSTVQGGWNSVGAAHSMSHTCGQVGSPSHHLRASPAQPLDGGQRVFLKAGHPGAVQRWPLAGFQGCRTMGATDKSAANSQRQAPCSLLYQAYGLHTRVSTSVNTHHTQQDSTLCRENSHSHLRCCQKPGLRTP